MKKYQVSNFSDNQLQIVVEALEIYSRLLSGQIESSLWTLFYRKGIDSEKFRALCRELKQEAFPDLAFNESYGVGWRPGNLKQNYCQIAYEIEKMIRNFQWKEKGGKPEHSVDGSEPLHYSDEELVVVKEE